MFIPPACNDPSLKTVNRDKPMTMKLFTACGVALLLLLNSCKKDKAPSSSIVGTWEIQSSRGSIPTITYASGNDSLLKFTSSTYTVYSKGQVVKSGTYSIVADSSFDALVVQAGEFTHRIIYDGNDPNTSFKKFLQVSGNKLTFISGNFALDSGSETIYRRVAGE
jgi:hypothetical protein